VHFHLEAAQGELRTKGRRLVKAIADRLVEEDVELAKALYSTLLDLADVQAAAEPLSKSDTDATYNIAAGSQMGNRAVGPGGSGPNIASFSPVQLKPQTSARMRERVEGQKKTDEELAFARHAMDVRKEGMKLIWNTPDDSKVFELPQPTHRSDTAQNALDEAPAQKLRLEDNADRLRAGSAESAPNHVGQKPTGPALMLPASYEKCEQPSDATPAAAPTLGLSAAAPKPASVSLDGPLAMGGSHTVKKRGLGEVTLTRGDSGYTVDMDGFDPVEFASLSAACDHVWARAKGYDGADAYKEAHGVNKVPSGAGWKFWGLKRKRAA